jgi:hypothetical protein
MIVDRNITLERLVRVALDALPSEASRQTEES